MVILEIIGAHVPIDARIMLSKALCTEYIERSNYEAVALELGFKDAKEVSNGITSVKLSHPVVFQNAQRSAQDRMRIPAPPLAEMFAIPFCRSDLVGVVHDTRA